MGKTNMKNVKIGNFFVGQECPLTIISGPCVIEGEMHTMHAAEFLHNLFSKLPVQFIFKSSYDKANRSSINSFRGPGIEEGLKILEKVKKEFGIPVFTDIHTPQEAIEASSVCDVIQIPAFLCRQTDLLVTAGKTGSVVNIKKGQFMAPWDMKNVIEKITTTGNDQILLTERGTSFGYNNLVTDLRAIAVMQKFGYPVIYDATHAAQLPAALGSKTGGQREFIPVLTRAAIAAGCNAIYIESHPNPECAKSDSETVLSFDQLPSLVEEWIRIYDAVNNLTAAK